MIAKLTDGAVQTLSEGGSVDKPVLQVLGYKKIPGGSVDRYRMLVSDGQTSHTFAMLATQLNEKVENKELEPFTVIRLDKYICNQVNNDKRILVLLDITVLNSAGEVGGKIGNPVMFSATPAAGNSIVKQEVDVKPKFATGNGPSETFSRPTTSSFGQPSKRSTPYTKSSTPYGSLKAETSSVGGQSPSQKVYPINSLTPYQNKWIIRARVSSKASVRTWSNSRGEGKLFSFDLVDASGEIRVTAFNEQCDKYFNIIELNKVYFVSNCQIKSANKNFSSLKNDYEMTLRNDSTIEPCHEPCHEVPTMQFNFVPIAQLLDLPKDALVDVIGVCKGTTDVQSIVTKSTGRELKKRELTLVDQTNKEVNLTMWGTAAENFDGSSNPVIAVKGARVSDYGGCSLSTLMQSTLQINPEVKEAFVLKGWFEREGSRLETQSISTRGQFGALTSSNTKFLANILSENLGLGEKPDYFSCLATITLVKMENSIYQACHNESCNKKLIDLGNGTFRCEKCKDESSEFKWRLMLNINISDFSSNQWVTCFQEFAETIVGRSSAELGQMREENFDEYKSTMSSANFKTFLFKLRTKAEVYNDETRLKTTVVAVSPINYKDCNQSMIQNLSSL